MKKKVKILLFILLILLVLIIPGFYNALRVVPYRLTMERVTGPVRLVLVTDLHACAYGEDQRELVDAINAQAPDLVLLGGDIFDDDLPMDNTVAFLRQIGEKYPCYYVTGNHEYWSGEENFARMMAILAECRVTRLSGEMVTLEFGGERINLCGVDDPFAWADRDGSFREQLAHIASLPRDGAYTILLTHRPELVELYCEYGFDLVLAGHAHGGQWRIPGILNGLYAPNQGLFPAYAGGRYDLGDTVMIVSRGLARESTRMPRFYNRPELVVVELGSKGGE